MTEGSRVSDQASKRKYLPADYLDECVPPLEDSPNGWIVTLPGDAYGLKPFYEDEEPERILKTGDVVAFCYTENYGVVSIDIAADGKFTVLRGSIDPRANCVRIDFDNDTIDESVQSLAANWIMNGADPGVAEVDQYFWSSGEDYWFETGPSGPRFVLNRSVKAEEAGS